MRRRFTNLLSAQLLAICVLELGFATPLAAEVQERDWFPGTSSIEEKEVIPPGYQGTWAPTPEACSDPDGVTQIHVSSAGVDTYESGGRLERVTQAGQERSIKLKLAFEGEGEFWDAVEIWTINEAGNRLTRANEQGHRPTTYVHCSGVTHR